jgi:cell division protein FtsI (penicillin-binding protein 3)
VKSRLILVFTFLLVLGGILLGRGLMLQVLNNDKLENLKQRQFSRTIKIPARRGAIYDRHGKELALTVTTYSLFADPQLITQPRTITRKLNRYLKLPYRTTLKNLTKKGRFVWLQRGLDKEKRDHILTWKVRGLGFIEEAKRIYPNGVLASQILGSVGRDGHGLEGIERKYDDYLSGSEKTVHVLRDARGRPLIAQGDVYEQEHNGKDIYLTIDRDLQYFVEKELNGAIKEYDADSAMA